MTYTGEHMLMQWSGSFRNSTYNSDVQEIFSGTLRFFGPGIDAVDNNQTAGSLAITLAQYWANQYAYVPEACFLESVKWNRIQPDGHYASFNTREVVVSNVQGTGSRGYPHQVAWATTWQTDTMRGKAARGRTYWPTGVALDPATGKVDPVLSGRKANADANLIRDLTYAARSGMPSTVPSTPPQWAIDFGWAIETAKDATGPVPCVMSSIGAGTTRVITAAGVGGRLDIQRRRGNSMADTRVIHSTAGA